MKILHTSDWHLGQEFYSYDRREEHSVFFEQLETIVDEERPDVMVVSGDIYHTVAPSNAVMKMFTDSLVRICGACPTMKVVVIAGNHDSNSRLEVNRSLWSHFNVSIVGSIERNGEHEVDLSKNIIPVCGADGAPIGYVVAIPHLFNRAYPSWIDGQNAEERQQMFYEKIAAALGDTRQLPIVMMAHMAVAGCNLSEHDDSRGNLEYVAVSTLDIVPYDYLALGHIHYPQDIATGRPTSRARYCGSPLPVSFDEEYEHSVSIVEIGQHGSRGTCRTIPIVNPRPVVTLPREAADFETALKELSRFPDGEKAYVRLHVKLDGVAPADAIERAERAVVGKACRFCCFKWERPQLGQVQAGTVADINEFRLLSPVEVAGQYYRDRFGKEMAPELVELVDGIYQQMKRNNEE